jgi:hypothetical protein
MERAEASNISDVHPDAGFVPGARPGVRRTFGDDGPS